ncbi:MAG: hypothetical protein NDJ18_02150 [candidate division Zixibacteria bacterium]|nr:hypothetical protein [candidate division Zixibacteria bacterium]
MIKLLSAFVLLISPVMIFAGPAHFYDINDEPDTTYATNVVIDIIEHNGGIWFATGQGVNFSFDNGQTWLLYNTSNGLAGNDVSAIYSAGTRLWIATNHVGIVNGFEEVFSDGLTYTDNDGATWTQLDFSEAGLDIPYVTGPFRTIYDIGGASDFQGRDWVFAAAFAGGLLGSADGGTTWQRLFATRDDSLNFENAYKGLDTLWWRNRLFSVVADTSHGDSLYLWAGTAGGILQFVYLTPADKFSARVIQKVAICESCTGVANNFAWFGGVNGLTRGHTTGGPFQTRFPIDFGQFRTRVTAMQEFGGKLFLGLADSVLAISQGLYVSGDNGDTFDPVPTLLGSQYQIVDFAVIRDRLYAANLEDGLWVSGDTGTTWGRIYLDSAVTGPSNLRNITHSLESIGDTLFVGTDSGLSIIFLDPAGAIDSARHYVPDPDSSASRVTQIRVQLFTDTVSLVNDSFALWTINRQVGGVGRPTVSVSKDRGLTWSYYLANGEVYDIAPVNVPKDPFKNVYIVGPTGIKFIATGTDPNTIQNAIVRDAVDTTLLLSTDTVNAVVTKGDTVLFGGNRGIALSRDRGRTYRVYTPNLDPLKADLVVSYTVATTINNDTAGASVGLIGNFIPALGIQYLTPDTARIIASCRPTTSGGYGVSVGRVVPVFDTNNVQTGSRYRFDVVYFRNFAWNIAAHGDTLFLPTDDGLITGWDLLGDGATVDTVAFRNAQGKDLLFPGTPVYAAKVIDGYLWSGTDDGTVRISLADLADQKLYIRTDPTEEVYAFPVPFSPNRDDRVRFHFAVPADGNVTLEIYDFAMNLVATPIENQFFDAGIYPPGPTEDQRPYWDGRNDKGDVVAVGVYYFRIMYGNGESAWGKLAIVP